MLSSQDCEAGEDVEKIGSLIWNYYNLHGVQSNLGGAKNITAPFVVLLSPRAFQIEHLLIFLEEMFSDERDLMLELVNQNFNWACWFCHRSFLPSPVKGTEELVCSWAHSLGSAQQARSHYD